MYTAVPAENLTAAELFARRQVKLTEKKEMIAETALLVIENPEENVCSKLVYNEKPFLCWCIFMLCAVRLTS